MKTQALLPTLLLMIVFSCNAPETDTASEEHITDVQDDTLHDTFKSEENDDEWIVSLTHQIDPYVNAILNEDFDFLVAHTSFPIRREEPLPPLMNEEDFKARFSLIFDDKIKEKLTTYLTDHDVIDRTGADGSVGILNGGLWFTDQGELIMINYESKEEKEKREHLDQKVRRALHPVLKEYYRNIYIGKTENHLFRIDATEDGLRYAQWFDNYTMADEPDFILYNGISEPVGSGGNWLTTFDKYDTRYILEEVALCESPEDCGDFLIIEDEGIIMEKWPVTRILDPFEALP